MLKSYFTYLIIILSVTGTLAQSWFSTDHRWDYTVSAVSATGFSRMSVVDTITVNQQSAYRLQNDVTGFISGDTIQFQNEFICYEENNQVFCLDDFDTFQLLYDFNMQVGDSIFYLVNNESNNCSSLIKYHLDSLSTVQLGNDTLTVQHFTYSDTLTTRSAQCKVVEFVGFVGTEFGDVAVKHLCTIDVSGFLLCSFSNGDETIDLGEAFSCNAIPVATSDLSLDNFTINPNPVIDYLSVSEANTFEKMYVIDALGNLHLTSNAKQRLDISNLDPGLYVLVLLDKKMQRYAQQFVKL